jgi:hypothetical protein
MCEGTSILFKKDFKKFLSALSFLPDVFQYLTKIFVLGHPIVSFL